MIGCIIQARIGSSRLPGKVLMPIDGEKTVNFHVLNQLKFCNLIDKIVVATTNLEEDDILANYVQDLGFDCFRGSPNDVLDRYYNCAKQYSFSTIIRITSDNPVIDPQLIDFLVKKFSDNSFDYVSNTLERTYPHGIEAEVFSFKSLETSWKEASLPSEREHVTPYIQKYPKKFSIHNIKQEKDYSHLRCTVDRINDIELIKSIFLKIKKRPILTGDIISLSEKEPKLFELNKEYDLEEGYQKSLKEDKEFLKQKNSN
jgi:spore coat polysaccharide biosynthesis protein SpsF